MLQNYQPKSDELVDLRGIFLADNPVEWAVTSQETALLLRPKHGVFTPAQDKMLRQIAAKRWFLIRNNGPQGERWRCKRCGQVHPYFTLHCRHRPFNGLTHALGILKERVGPDMVLSAVALGSVEPITRERAQKLFEDLRGYGYSRLELLGV